MHQTHRLLDESEIRYGAENMSREAVNAIPGRRSRIELPF
jgi:hypothetical protein